MQWSVAGVSGCSNDPKKDYTHQPINLRYWRRESGLSHEKLAHLAGIDRIYVSAREREVYSVSVDMIQNLAQVLEIVGSLLLRRKRLGRIQVVRCSVANFI
jgi:transcriptional regulator with XRE-family HTH domain